MAEIKNLDQYLQRQVLTRFRKLDTRNTIRTALDTSSLQVVLHGMTLLIKYEAIMAWSPHNLMCWSHTRRDYFPVDRA